MVFSTLGEGEALPKDAILLNRKQAIGYQTLLIRRWEPQSHVFAVRYGHHFLAACTIIPSTIMNFTIRGKLKLINVGSIPTYLSTVAAPAIFTAMIYSLAVRDDILLLKGKSCPACIEAKAILVQNLFGVVFPVSMSVLTNYTIATQISSVRLPHYKDWKAVLRKWASLTKPLSRIIAYSLVFHTLTASFVAYKSMESVIQVHDCLKLLEEQEETDKYQ